MTVGRAVCVALLGVAAVLWGASVLTWFRGAGQERLRGPVDGAVGAGVPAVEITGAQVLPALGGVALLALAAVAAVVAVAGPARRVLGGLLALAGASVCVASVRAAATGPPAGASANQAVEVTAAPAAAVLGGLLLVAVGLVVVVRERGLPRLGAGCAAPGTRRPPPLDPDRATWVDLDEGRDPTV